MPEGVALPGIGADQLLLQRPLDPHQPRPQRQPNQGAHLLADVCEAGVIQDADAGRRNLENPAQLLV